MTRLQADLPHVLRRVFTIAAIACLIAAIFTRWYLAPGAVSADGNVTPIEPAITWLFRALCVAALLIARSPGAAPALLLALLLFPTAILHTSPDAAARTAWLVAQHDQLTGYTGDIYTSQEVRDATWLHRVVVVDDPIENHILKLPVWTPANLEWGRFLEIAEWFGLSPWFSQGLARGWVLAVAGAILLLLARGRFSVCWIGAMAIVVVFASLPFLLCAHRLAQARDLVRGGDFTAALTALDRAASALPAARQDGAFLLQVGRLESELSRATPAADLYRAIRLAREGYAQQAQSAFLALITAAEPGTALHRESVKGLLTRAIRELNSGHPHPAIALLETVLAADPCNLKANYALQIAHVRADRGEELPALIARMQQTYRFLNTPTKRSPLAAAQEHLAFAELHAGRSARALAHWRLSRRPPK